MKGWLTSENITELEVGTVESFQGKEKRVILVSTVRANCRLLDYDAKYGLGFLVDDKVSATKCADPIYFYCLWCHSKSKMAD